MIMNNLYIIDYTSIHYIKIEEIKSKETSIDYSLIENPGFRETVIENFRNNNQRLHTACLLPDLGQNGR